MESGKGREGGEEKRGRRRGRAKGEGGRKEERGRNRQTYTSSTTLMSLQSYAADYVVPQLHSIIYTRTHTSLHVHTHRQLSLIDFQLCVICPVETGRNEHHLSAPGLLSCSASGLRSSCPLSDTRHLSPRVFMSWKQNQTCKYSNYSFATIHQSHL